MKQIIAAACGALLALAAPVQAQTENAVVVELYTSQGCSSCPPADALLGELAADPAIIALALHVDYWDYLGWKDKFASPKFTARQKAYAHHIRDKMVYTPQMIINGDARMVGSRTGEVRAAIQAQMGRKASVDLDVERKGGVIVIEMEPSGTLQGVYLVQLVRYQPRKDVNIERGENAGRQVSYHNVVTSWQQLGEWNGKSPLRMEAKAPGQDGAVVIVQEEGPARIVAAAALR
jgi:hypothetical protein